LLHDKGGFSTSDPIKVMIGIIIEDGIGRRIMLIILGLLRVYWGMVSCVGELVWGVRLHSNHFLILKKNTSFL